VAADLARRIGEAVRVLSAAFGLRGWCSLDFMRGGDTIGVLEVNPRPPASLSLYAQRGLIDAQLRACLQAELPPAGAFAARRVAGCEIVYARRSLTLDPIGAQHLARRSDVHDLPLAGARFGAGDPICSLSAAGDSADQVRAMLGAAREALLHTLETM
jgi:predicted ATP-grasp superfamily ATP-dependent carboligase